MTLAAERWPSFADPSPGGAPDHGVAVVWRLELAKLCGQVRVRSVAAACVAAPLLVAAAVKVQSAVPDDTLFGQWLHSSGYALPLVILGFVGQWVLPLMASIVAGDIFSAEDHFGTWKTVLTRSRSRGQIFGGKLLAAMTYATVMLVVLAGSSLLAGVLLGTSPLVGLSGQLVAGGHATGLVVASWASQLPPLLGFCGLAVLLSVATRSSPVGMGGPVLIGLVMQLSTLVDMPESVRSVLLATPFAAWHGFWVQSPFYGPLREGLMTSAVWFVLCVVVAWMIFRARSIGAS